ncbi:MAG: dihydroorotase [bacterium]
MNSNKNASKGSAVVLISGGRLLDPAAGVDAVTSILIKDGKVVSLGTIAEAGARSADSVERMDAGGLWLLPGLVDMHVHLREPGEEGKETIASGTRAAAAGGVTTLVAMPNTVPATDSVAMVELVRAKVRAEGVVNVLLSAAVTKNRQGTELTEIGELARAGVVLFTDDGDGVANSELMRRALQYGAMFKVLFMQHCEDKALSEGGAMNEGLVSLRLGLRGYPKAAEAAMAARDIVLAESIGTRIHFGHLSGRQSLDLVRAAKARGLAVSAETAPHFFALSEQWLAEHPYDSAGKMNPPLGSEEDRLAVIAALKDGTLDCIATDHAPHGSLDKAVEFDKAAFGILGLETSLALALDVLVHGGHISALRAVELLSAKPADLLGLKGAKGTLAQGADADLCLVAPDEVWTVDPDKFQSKSRNTPFARRALRGKVKRTMVAGRWVYDDQKGILV